jgi:kynureninase
VSITRSTAEALDVGDPLAGARQRFYISDPSVIYFDGNSLGRLPAHTPERIADVVERQWGQQLIRSWGEGWMELPAVIGDRLGETVLGASLGETIVCDNVTVNIKKLMYCAQSMRPDRSDIIAHRGDFPTDRYLAEHQARARGGRVRWIEHDSARDPRPLDADDVAALLDENVAFVHLSAVDYRSAAIADLVAITNAAHDAGALIIWDLSHAAGSIELDLHTIDADFAVGCSYKYLNGGPGAPAWLWVNSRLHDELSTPIPGWMGHADVFEMADGYVPADGVRRFMTGTPSPIALAAVASGVDIIAEFGMPAIAVKAQALTSFAIDLVDELLDGLGVELASPRSAPERGAHITLRHQDAQALVTRLTQRGVIPDFRHPEGIRIGLSPLTTRFSEVFDGLSTLADLIRDETADSPTRNK